MPVTMTESELAIRLNFAREIERFDGFYIDETGGLVNAVLFQSADGRYFRYVEQSAVQHPPAVYRGFGEWLTIDERRIWNQL